MKTKKQQLAAIVSLSCLFVSTIGAPVTTVYAETLTETTQEPSEIPTTSLPEVPYMGKTKESVPRFFFKQTNMTGIVGEISTVLFFSDQEIEETWIQLPKEVTIVEERLPAGLSVTKEEDGQWQLRSKGTRNTFSIPVTAEATGSYTLGIEGKNEATLVIEEAPTVPEESVENPEEEKSKDEQEADVTGEEESEQESDSSKEAESSEEEIPSESEKTEIEVTASDGDTAEVTTFEELREAVSDDAISTIEVQANLTRSGTGITTAIGNLNRDLVIRGNGFTINLGADNGGLQLAELADEEQAILRVENTIITKTGALPVFNSVGGGRGWCLELENISEGSTNAARLASIPEGIIEFTGGENRFIRAITGTFITAKQVVISNNSGVTINRGSSNYFFSGADVDNPSIKIRDNSQLNITTASGTNNPIALRGINPSLTIEGNSRLLINSPGTTATPEDTSNNVISMNRENAQIVVNDDSELKIVTTNNKRGIHLPGANASIHVNHSKLDVQSVTAPAINLADESGTFSSDKSNIAISTTIGRGLLSGNKIHLLDSVFTTGSTTGIPLSTQSAFGKIEVTNSEVELEMTGSNNGILMQGEDSFLSINENSQVKLSAGSGTARNILLNGDRSKIYLQNNSLLSVNTSGPTNEATDTTNNAIQITGSSTEFFVDNSDLNVSIRSGAKRGIAMIGNNANLNLSQGNVQLMGITGTNLRLAGDNVGLHLSNGAQLTTQVGEGNSIELIGNAPRLVAKDVGTKIDATSNRVTGVDGATTVFIGSDSFDTATSGAEISLTESAQLAIKANNSSGLALRSNNGEFNLTKQAILRIDTGRAEASTGGSNSPLRFMRSGPMAVNNGGYRFVVDDAELNIQKAGGNTSGVRMWGNDNQFLVRNGGNVRILNPGNGTAHDGNSDFGNQGIHFTRGNGITEGIPSKFSVEDTGSTVEIIANSGPAIDMGTQSGTINVSNGGYFSASGRTATANAGILQTTSTFEITFDNPIFMDFRNNRSGGGNIFNVANGSTLTAVSSDLAVWRRGTNLDADPHASWTNIDYRLSGANFSTIASTNVPDEFNSTAFGSMANYSRLSSNNSQAIVDELRVPTNADKFVFGHVSVGVGTEDMRSAWQEEVEVEIEVEKKDGRISTFKGRTFGTDNSNEGLSVYGEEPRGGLFKVAIDDFLEAGDKVRVIGAARGNTRPRPSSPENIQTGTVDVFPIVPPTPARFSSNIIGSNARVIQGYTENPDVEVTITYNGEPVDTSAVQVKPDGQFEISLEGLSLQADDELQVFLRDKEGLASAAGVVFPPETNNKVGNINPVKALAFHDTTFEPATRLVVAQNVAPVDPLEPEKEVDPENPPTLPEDQGRFSIDFVSQFDFGVQAISAQDQTYYAKPQRLLAEDGTVLEGEERPNYVQVSDRRSTQERDGWELSVRQNDPFTNRETGEELTGARLILQNQQIATAQGGTAPGLAHTNPMALNPGGAKRTLLKAQGPEGEGTWIYRFGDADSADKSVALEVPRGATPSATSYQTTLTWELSSVPDN